MIDSVISGLLLWAIKTIAEEPLKEGGRGLTAHVKKLLSRAQVEPGQLMSSESYIPHEPLEGINRATPSEQVRFAKQIAPIVPSLRQVGNEVSAAWVPDRSEGFCGIDISGAWNPRDQSLAPTYIRQFGPFFNVFKLRAENPPLYAEGLINPKSGFLFFDGQYVPGPPIHFEGYLTREGTISGRILRSTPWGQQLLPIEFARVQ